MVSASDATEVGCGAGEFGRASYKVGSDVQPHARVAMQVAAGAAVVHAGGAR